MNGKLVVVVFVLCFVGYVFSQSSNPKPETITLDYAPTIAVAAAYESLSSPQEVVQDSVVEEVVQEVAEQMEVLVEPEVQTIPVSQTVESEIVTPVENSLDDTENVAWEKLNDIREAVGLKRLTFAEDLLGGCREHADKQRKRRSLWHDRNRGNCGENCAFCEDEQGTSPLARWCSSEDHRKFMLSPSISEGAVGRSGNYWVFRARSSSPTTKTVTIARDTGNPKDVSDVEVKENSVQNTCTGNSCTTGYASDGQRTVKTYTRTGRHRPLRYTLWRVFN
jgi:uncharacterized protein YkwD